MPRLSFSKSFALSKSVSLAQPFALALALSKSVSLAQPFAVTKCECEPFRKSFSKSFALAQPVLGTASVPAMSEQQKYAGIYASSARYRTYGHTNHGEAALSIAREWKCRDILDIGCGHNEFCIAARAEGITAVGVDFACPSADVIGDATHLQFGTKSYDLITAFDMLEHLLPDQVDEALAEFARVSERFIFSIAYTPSRITWNGENLHPTVQSEDWWVRRIARAGGTHIVNRGRYLTGRWTNPRYKVPSSCVLVGNGPSVKSGDFGDEIDSHEEVIRFNNFHLRGWERHTGSKVTLWANNVPGRLPIDEDIRPQRVLSVWDEHKMPPYPIKEIYRIARRFYDRWRAVIQYRSGVTDEAKRAIIKPTSGLLVAWWLLEVFEVKCLNLVGFDHFSKERSKLHHYWLPTGCKQPSDHCGHVEAAIFAEWEAAGRVKYLSGVGRGA